MDGEYVRCNSRQVLVMSKVEYRPKGLGTWPNFVGQQLFLATREVEQPSKKVAATKADHRIGYKMQ